MTKSSLSVCSNHQTIKEKKLNWVTIDAWISISALTNSWSFFFFSFVLLGSKDRLSTVLIFASLCLALTKQNVNHLELFLPLPLKWAQITLWTWKALWTSLHRQAIHQRKAQIQLKSDTICKEIVSNLLRWRFSPHDCHPTDSLNAHCTLSSSPYLCSWIISYKSGLPQNPA